jgi:asparagine synthase (glutamine-hydrolysing)
MCGVYGMVNFAGPLRSPDHRFAMGERLRHRGPDDTGYRMAHDALVGAERLRIRDPRPRGAQPFVDPDDRIWVACNGAVYNDGAVRRRYADYPFRSTSDIESIVPLYLDLGVEGVAELDGMFALAIWDTRRKRLILTRDRAGEKPLFWRVTGHEVWFASEIQALLTPGSVALDRSALADYVRLGYPREPRTMLRGIEKVPSGTALVFESPTPTAHRFWHPEAVPETEIQAAAAQSELERLLRAAVTTQIAADVPIGVLTSGGVDSALLAVLAARALEPRPLHTFAVGFTAAGYDERHTAAAVAGIVRSSHVSVSVDDTALQAALDVVTDRVAEPIADPAILPSYLLAREARRHVGVVLSGEGADELFGGYPTYIGHRLVPAYRRVPTGVRAAFEALLRALPVSHGKVTLDFLLRRFTAHAQEGLLQRHVSWFGTGLPADLLSGGAPDSLLLAHGEAEDSLRRIMLFDYRTYLPDNLLPKVDRATMLVGLEARAPYLDRDLTTFALGLPMVLKVRGLETKWLLKRLARRVLPAGIVQQRKRGLSVPIASWINGGLRSEVDRLLALQRLEAAGLFEPLRVRQLLTEHRAGHANHARALWPLVMFERWRERWMGV